MAAERLVLSRFVRFSFHLVESENRQFKRMPCRSYFGAQQGTPAAHLATGTGAINGHRPDCCLFTKASDWQAAKLMNCVEKNSELNLAGPGLPDNAPSAVGWGLVGGWQTRPDSHTVKFDRCVNS
jgi:hypothetical protein